MRSLRSLLWPGLAEGEQADREAAIAPPPPDAHDSEPLAITRAFAFLDIRGFTAYCDRHGERAAVELLTRFRDLTRAVAIRRGVRVSKWLGDGVMLVGLEPAPLAATAAEIVARCSAAGIHIHAGLASGPVLLFEGDDYIGRPANLAARLCDVAGEGEVLVHGDFDVPDWLALSEPVTISVPGIGEVSGVRRLTMTIELPPDGAGELTDQPE
ncbi:MAG: adenylate/guanylate cyclase domain-containing protein [Acidimicrobiales bacterium]|nr:adenylate/guanylate cyclase domain-containing protein [Acidimicrobiales bacterium]